MIITKYIYNTFIVVRYTCGKIRLKVYFNKEKGYKVKLDILNDFRIWETIETSLHKPTKSEAIKNLKYYLSEFESILEYHKHYNG